MYPSKRATSLRHHLPSPSKSTLAESPSEPLLFRSASTKGFSEGRAFIIFDKNIGLSLSRDSNEESNETYSNQSQSFVLDEIRMEASPFKE